MIDGEADGAAVRRALIHVETCPRCRDFLATIREHVQLHRDLCDPRLLLRSLRPVDAAGIFTRSSIKANLRRLSEFFYQLGKAYLLLATDKRYMLQVFEEPVPVVEFKNRGRGFVDGLLSGAQGPHLSSGWRGAVPREESAAGEAPLGEDTAAQESRTDPRSGARRDGSYDWIKARALLNGQLEKVGENMEKARILLEEALLVRPSFAEARLYKGFYHQARGEMRLAEAEYRRVFETARRATNRAHAAVQLGVIMNEQERFDAAISCFRWVTRTGMVRRDPRFYFAYYNLGLLYARSGDFERCRRSFEILYDRFRDRGPEIRRFLRRANAFLDLLSRKPALNDALAQACPDWFGAGPQPSGPISNGSAPRENSSVGSGHPEDPYDATSEAGDFPDGSTDTLPGDPGRNPA